MCQCGCGEIPIEQAYKLPNGNVISYSVYRGCADCHAGPGIEIGIFNNSKSEWLEHAKIQPITPTTYGGSVSPNSHPGISVGLFEVQDLVAAAKELGDELDDDGYDSVSAWLEDMGLEMVQSAMRKFDVRTEEISKRLEGR